MNSDNNLRPMLIDPDVHQNMQQKVERESISQTKYIKEFFRDFYYNYIKPYYSVIICLLIIFILLYIRYMFICQDRAPSKKVKEMELKEMMIREQKRQHMQMINRPQQRMHIPLRQDDMPIGGYDGQNIESFNLILDPRSPYYGGDPFNQQQYDDLFTRSVPLVDAYPQRPLSELKSI